MELNSTLHENVDTLFTNLQSFTQNEGVLGKPMSYEDKTFIPVVSLTLGYGGGNTTPKNQQNNTGSQNMSSAIGNMGAGALGLGARLTTDAIVVIDKGNVSMMQLTPMAGNVSQMINQIPQILMGKNQGSGQQGQQGQQSQQGQNGQQNQQ